VADRVDVVVQVVDLAAALISRSAASRTMPRDDGVTNVLIARRRCGAGDHREVADALERHRERARMASR